MDSWTLDKQDIEEVFANAENTPDVVIGLYTMAFPNWDDIKKIKGWPKIGKEVSKLLWDKFIAFDKKNHPRSLAGGVWMNHGFSTDDSLPPWGIDTSNCEVIYE